MKTIEDFNEKIENYFKENGIIFYKNYLIAFKKQKFTKKKYSFEGLNINEYFKDSLLILFNNNDVEIFSCELNLSFSGMEIKKIGEKREKLQKSDIKLRKKLIGYELLVEKGKFKNIYNFSKSYKKDLWLNKNLEYILENKLI